MAGFNPLAFAAGADVVGSFAKFSPGLAALTGVAGAATMGGYLPGPLGALKVAQVGTNMAGIKPQISATFRSAMMPPSVMYGKRGLDANRLNTDGLSLSLYRGRRKS